MQFLAFWAQPHFNGRTYIEKIFLITTFDLSNVVNWEHRWRNPLVSCTLGRNDFFKMINLKTSCTLCHLLTLLFLYAPGWKTLKRKRFRFYKIVETNVWCFRENCNDYRPAIRKIWTFRWLLANILLLQKKTNSRKNSETISALGVDVGSRYRRRSRRNIELNIETNRFRLHFLHFWPIRTMRQRKNPQITLQR